MIWLLLFATSVIDTRGKFASGVNDTSGTGSKFGAGVVDIGDKMTNLPPGRRWCALTCDYLREFSKKTEMTHKLFSGAWGIS